MRVGMMGLGRLGLPVARAMASRGHEVVGYDVRPVHDEIVHVVPSVGDLARESDLIFVAIQTPHEPRFEGVTRLPGDRRDFDYTYLQAGLVALSDRLKQPTPVAVISTMLPGTMAKEIKPLVGPKARLVYNPSFIAQGTVERDFLDPEFVLLGVDDPWALSIVSEFYRTITDAHQVKTSVANAELIKVAYNTFIGLKIVFANTLMEICHKMHCDVDEVTDALKLAHRRLISPMYLTAGMGDGGGCHPRDNIALSWLARDLGLSYDLFEKVMLARESQAEWIARTAQEWAQWASLDIVVLGKAFKPGVNQVTGSPAVLVSHLIAESATVRIYDPHVDGEPLPDFVPSVFVIGTKHPEFAQVKFPKGSIVLDPFRYIPEQEGVTVIGLGRAPRRVSVSV